MIDRQMTGSGLSRRGFLTLGVGAVALASLPLAARRPRLVRRTLPVMGTIADIVVLSGSVTVAHGAIDAAFDELRRVERLMTRFDPHSDVGRVNRAQPGQAVPVSAETAAVIAEALRWAHATAGAYDPAFGAGVELWDVTHRTEPPSPALVERLVERRLYRAVEVGTSGGAPVVVRHDGDARIDLGSIAKGYGVDRAAAALRAWGVDDAVVDVGGDLVAVGRGIDGDGWRIGIQSPHSANEVARVVRVSDAAVATSGTYAQFFTYKGRRYHHLLDPVAATPRVTIMQSLTVQSDSCMHADAAATACYGRARGEMSAALALGAPASVVVSTM